MTLIEKLHLWAAESRRAAGFATNQLTVDVKQHDAQLYDDAANEIERLNGICRSAGVLTGDLDYLGGLFSDEDPK